MKRKTELAWPAGWAPVDDLQRAALTLQLYVEIGRKAAQEGLVREVIGAREGSRDVVVIAMRGWEAPYAVARLAWDRPDPRPWAARLFGRKLRPALQPLDRIESLARWTG